MRTRGGGGDGEGSDEDEKRDQRGESVSSLLSTRSLRDQQKASQVRSGETVFYRPQKRSERNIPLRRKGMPPEERKTKRGEKEESDLQQKANEVDRKGLRTPQGSTSRQVAGRSRLAGTKKASQEDEKGKSLHERRKNLREHRGGSKGERWRRGQVQEQEKEDRTDNDEVDSSSSRSSSSKPWIVADEGGTSQVRRSQMNRKKKKIRTGEETEEGSSCPPQSLNRLPPHNVNTKPSSDMSDGREEEGKTRKENPRRLDGASHDKEKALSLDPTASTRERRRRGRDAELAAERASSPSPSSVSPFVEKEGEGERRRRKQGKKKEGVGEDETEKGGGEEDDDEEEEAGAVVNLLTSEVPNTVFKVGALHSFFVFLQHRYIYTPFFVSSLSLSTCVCVSPYARVKRSVKCLFVCS